MFKERLVHLRKEKGISQYALADQLGLSRGQISNYELGARQPDYETLKRIAQYFNVSIDYLLGNSIEDKEMSNPRRKANEFLTAAKEFLLNEEGTTVEYIPFARLINAARGLTNKQVAALTSVALAMQGKETEGSDDPIADLPYLHLKLRALREEKGLSLEDAAIMIDKFMTPEILRAYEEGQMPIEPNDQLRITAFYDVSWAFLNGRTNIRKGHAGILPTIEAAHRTDDPTKPLPPEAQESLDDFKKKHGFYYEEGEGKKDTNKK